MTDSVHHWEVYCQTTSTYQFVWSPNEPTTCPENAAHTISTSPGPRKINTVSQSHVKITEEEALPTQGIYKFKGYKMDIPSGNIGNITTQTLTWDYPITIMNGYVVSTDAMVNDDINAYIASNTTIGAIGANVYTGNSSIIVTSTVFDNLYKGWSVNITDGVNNDDLGECIDMDSGNSLITCTGSATNNFSPLSPTYVQMTAKLIEDFCITAPNVKFGFAEKKIGGRSLPPGIDLTVRYVNNTGNAKPFCYYLEYLY